MAPSFPHLASRTRRKYIAVALRNHPACSTVLCRQRAVSRLVLDGKPDWESGRDLWDSAYHNILCTSFKCYVSVCKCSPRL